MMKWGDPQSSPFFPILGAPRKIAPPGPKNWLRRWKVIRGKCKKGLAEFVEKFCYLHNISISLVMSL